LNIQNIFTFLVYLFCSVIISYYYNLLISKNEYSRDELQKLIPQLINIWNKVSVKYAAINMIFIVLISALIGGGIPGIFTNSLINSAIIPFLVFYFLPKVAIYFEETRVTTSESFTDILEDIYVKYYLLINSGFIAGYGSTLIFNWVNLGIISFYWFIINFIIITAILVLSLKEAIYD